MIFPNAEGSSLKAPKSLFDPRDQTIEAGNHRHLVARTNYFHIALSPKPVRTADDEFAAAGRQAKL